MYRTRIINPSYRGQKTELIKIILNAKELENSYGNRVRSRMRQLFNLIAFDKDSIDKRK